MTCDYLKRSILLTVLSLSMHTTLFGAEAVLPVINLQGDQHIGQPTRWENARYLVHGNVYLDPNGLLEVENAVVELACTYARQYNFWWNGGTLKTKNVTIGGTKTDGKVYQCNFEIRNGDWFSEETIIQYSYGQVFGDCSAVGRHHAIHLKSGHLPDSVIIGGRGDAVLKDSNFNISLNLYLQDKPSTTVLDLPVNTPLNRIYDKSNLPGTDYRLELDNTSVPLWWCFVWNVTNDGTPCEVILKDCPELIANVFANNLTGQVHLPCRQAGTGPIPPNTAIKIGRLTYRTLDKEAGVHSWGAYLNGDKTDLTLKGPTFIAELMVNDQGSVSLIGDKDTYNAYSSCSTIEVGNGWSKSPDIKKTRTSLHIKNATLGPPPEWGMMGDINTFNDSRVTIEHAILRDVTLKTKDTAEIVLKDVLLKGGTRFVEEGGPIRIYDKNGQAVTVENITKKQN